MAILRNRRTRRLLALAAVVLGSLTVYLVTRSTPAPYQAGEFTEGLTDALGRALPADAPAFAFTDVTGDAGLSCTHFPGQRTGLLSEDMGSGVALADVDGDGHCDALIMNIGTDTPAPTRLFRNRGDGTFEDRSESSGIAFDGIGMAATFCDTDSDGDLDLWLSSYGGLHLYRNEGDCHFTDISAAAGLAEINGFFAGLAPADYDRDGRLDLYACRYVEFDPDMAPAEMFAQFGIDIPTLLNPSAFEPAPNLLLHNSGDNHFEDRAAAAGVANAAGRSLGAMFCDLSGDGLPDIYVANDVSDNALFVNGGDGTFRDRTNDALVGDYRGAMGLTAGDFDGDLDLDFFVTHWVAQENGLYVNHTPPDTERGGVPLYMDAADRFGLGHVALDRVGWATRFIDFDADGRLDIFVVNGSTIPVEGNTVELVPMATQIFWNAGAKRGFFEYGATAGPFFAEKHVGRGGATFDYDSDGDEDLLLLLHGDGPRLLRNDTPSGKALRLRLRQRTGNTFAIGASIRAELATTTLLRVTDAQGSYLSQHAAGETAFGLGQATSVERLTITWPDGFQEQAGPFPANSLITWYKGEEPRVAPLARALPAHKPETADEQRAFYKLHGQAKRARIADRLATARDLYQQALALWPSHADSLYYLASCQAELGAQDAALATFKRLTTAHPDSSRGFMGSGLIHLERHVSALEASASRTETQASPAPHLDAAEAAFNRCHRINSEESRPILQLGIVSMLRADLPLAADRLSRAAMQNPRDPQAPYFAGRVAYLAGDLTKAQTHLDQAHSLLAGPAADASVSSEGNTRTGKPLVSQATPAGETLLTRWRSLPARPAAAQDEYRSPQ